ncbi:MAG: ferritin family protein [bacterium]|nr:ferritin family protein [bacterium]
MADLTTVEGILDFAIQCEQDAADFYSELASKAKSKAMKETFEHFAGEERSHKAKLIAIKDCKRVMDSAAKVEDLKIGDYLVDEQPTADTDYQGALIIAMKNEKAAFRLYSDLAARVDDASVKEVLLGLAQEEAKHKLRFEIEYDDNVLIEN